MMTAALHVLLLGDSIRRSYQPHVAELLKGSATVVGPADNCEYSLYTLSSLDRWMQEFDPPDVVHWNNGIHDVGHNPNRYPEQMPMDMYLANLELILKRLRAITPRIIWATTTPVHPRRPLRVPHWSWQNEEIDAYNQGARELMEFNEVPINDLHEIVWKNVDAYLSEDQLHLSAAGEVACAKAVADVLSPYLSER